MNYDMDSSQKPLPPDKNFLVTKTELPGQGTDTETLACVAAAVTKEKQRYAEARQELEDDWVDCWGHYFGNVRSSVQLRRDAARIVGDVNDDWRHKVTTGKAYENVETICGYLQSAFFPNKQWFAMTPTEPGYAELIKPCEKFLQKKLEVNRFISYWDMAVRQAVIVGTSVIALPWREETAKYLKRVPVRIPIFDNYGVIVGEKTSFDIREEDRVIFNDPDFEVLDMFDTYLDPTATNPNDANIIRKMLKTKAEMMQLIDEGFYNYGSKYNVAKCESANAASDTSATSKSTVIEFAGLKYCPEDRIEVLEFWGDLHLDGKTYHNIVATVSGGQVLRFEQNPYWYGKPFIVLTYVPVTRQVYGLGALQPSLGLYHEMNIITNQRLDNLELQVDAMWAFAPDGTLRKEDIESRPGKVFEVSDPRALTRIPTGDVTNVTVTYQESQFLETRIDKATGTGAFIGVGAGRSGERVTATEITAQRDAGGNRLSSRHQHLEDTALIPLLIKLFRGCQQFVKDDEIVRIPGQVPGSYEYAAVGAHELVHDFQFIAQGATYIADKEFELSKWLNFLNVVGGNPQMAMQINWPMVLERLVVKFGLGEDAEMLILPPPPPPTPAPPAPPDPMTQQLQQMGGNAMVDTFKGKQATGQLPAEMARLANDALMSGKGNPNDPAVAMAADQMMQQGMI